METNLPKVPEKGFYYHYKHDPNGPVNNYAYEVLGVALHTEQETLTVIYQPLYENKFLGSADFFSRPLEMFLEIVEKEGKKFPRFHKIENPDIIAKLLKFKASEIK